MTNLLDVAQFLTVACVQMNTQDDVVANITQAQAWLQQACEKGASLIALPENAFWMGAPGDAMPRHTLQNHPGIAAMQAQAKLRGVWVLVGSVGVVSEQDDKRMVNRSALINPNGEIVAQYDKIHLFDVTLPGGETYRESDRFVSGTNIVAAPMEAGTLGMSVCYDVRFPQQYRALAQQGAQVLAVPSAFTYTTGLAHWEVLLRARAIENGCFVIAPAQCGTHPGGRKTYGHSLIISPWGQVMADGGDAPGIITATLDLQEVARVRASIPAMTVFAP